MKDIVSHKKTSFFRATNYIITRIFFKCKLYDLFCLFKSFKKDTEFVQPLYSNIYIYFYKIKSFSLQTLLFKRMYYQYLLNRVIKVQAALMLNVSTVFLHAKSISQVFQTNELNSHLLKQFLLILFYIRFLHLIITYE